MDHHFSDKPDEIKAIYYEIIQTVYRCGQVQVSFLKNAIIISAKSSFMAIKPRTNYVDLEFILDKEINEFPIHKTFRVSRNKVAHVVKIGSLQDVDQSMKKWIAKAYSINAV